MHTHTHTFTFHGSIICSMTARIWCCNCSRTIRRKINFAFNLITSGASSWVSSLSGGQENPCTLWNPQVVTLFTRACQWPTSWLDEPMLWNTFWVGKILVIYDQKNALQVQSLATHETWYTLKGMKVKIVYAWMLCRVKFFMLKKPHFISTGTEDW